VVDKQGIDEAQYQQDLQQLPRRRREGKRQDLTPLAR